jgi:hypothetical protein
VAHRRGEGQAQRVVERRAELLERHAGGQVRGDGGEDVAPVKTVLTTARQ